MGRIPNSKKTHELNGNPSKRELTKDHAKVAPTSATPPTWISTIGKNLWKKLAPSLVDAGLLTEADREAFACLCQSYADYRQAVATLKKHGRTVATASGSVRPHPAVADEKTYREAFSNMCREFGLTPKSRSMITLDVKEEIDELDEFLRGNE